MCSATPAPQTINIIILNIIIISVLFITLTCNFPNGVIKLNSQMYCCHGRVAPAQAYNFYQRRELSWAWNNLVPEPQRYTLNPETKPLNIKRVPNYNFLAMKSLLHKCSLSLIKIMLRSELHCQKVFD